MHLTVHLHGFRDLGKERDVEVDEGATGEDLLGALGIPTESCILFRDREPVPIDEPLVEGADLRVVRIVSGGGR